MSVPQTKITRPAVAQPNPPEFEDAAAQALKLKGVVYLTILHWIPERAVMRRVYSTDPTNYPTGGEKAMPPDAAWPQTVIVQQEPHCCWTRKETADYYNDADDIFASGGTAVLCVPVLSSSGHTFGAFNFCCKEEEVDQGSLKEFQQLVECAGRDAFETYVAKQ